MTTSQAEITNLAAEQDVTPESDVLVFILGEDVPRRGQLSAPDETGFILWLRNVTTWKLVARRRYLYTDVTDVQRAAHPHPPAS